MYNSWNYWYQLVLMSLDFNLIVKDNKNKDV